MFVGAGQRPLSIFRRLQFTNFTNILILPYFYKLRLSILLCSALKFKIDYGFLTSPIPYTLFISFNSIILIVFGEGSILWSLLYVIPRLQISDLCYIQMFSLSTLHKTLNLYSYVTVEKQVAHQYKTTKPLAQTLNTYSPGDHIFLT
jgi:hypothetical protein